MDPTKTKIKTPTYDEFVSTIGASPKEIPTIREKMKKRIEEFEQKYKMTSAEFFPRYKQGDFEMDENYDDGDLFLWNSAITILEQMHKS